VPRDFSGRIRSLDGRGQAVKSQPWGPFRDNRTVIHRPGRRPKVVIGESDRKQGFDPQACAAPKPLMNQAKIEFSTVHDGHYQLPPGLKKRKT
jgi:hypothetical protein